MRITTCLMIALSTAACASGAELKVVADFPGGSARVENIDQKTRTVRLVPTPHKDRGWVCWWYLKLEGAEKGETITLDVGGGVWATPDRAAVSADDQTWKQTAVGRREGQDRIVYQHTVESNTVWFAWGPPFVLSHARELIDRATKSSRYVTPFELCKSRDGHSVPAMRIEQPGAAESERVGIWVQARQHAWESGGSWVCRGFVEWLLSDDPTAESLRKKATIYVVPIMDVDNVERGAGGKNQTPHDHNRDWIDHPVHPEVQAVEKRLTALHAAGRFHLFLDLHNPAPGDKLPFFYVPSTDVLDSQARDTLDRFLTAARKEMVGPPAIMPTTKETGQKYDAAWKSISTNWVAIRTEGKAVAVCLETAWNTPHGTIAGYRTVGMELGRATARFFRESPHGK